MHHFFISTSNALARGTGRANTSIYTAKIASADAGNSTVCWIRKGTYLLPYVSLGSLLSVDLLSPSGLGYPRSRARAWKIGRRRVAPGLTKAPTHNRNAIARFAISPRRSRMHSGIMPITGLASGEVLQDTLMSASGRDACQHPRTGGGYHVDARLFWSSAQVLCCPTVPCGGSPMFHSRSHP